MGVVAFRSSAASSPSPDHMPARLNARLKRQSLVAVNILQRLALTRPDKLDFLMALALTYLKESPPPA